MLESDEGPVLAGDVQSKAVDESLFILPTHCGLEQAGVDFRTLGEDEQAKALANERVPPDVKAAWVEWFRKQEGK